MIAPLPQMLFAVGTAPLGDSMTTVRIDELILGELPQPQMEREPRILHVIGQPLAGFQQDILDDVAGVNPLRDHPIHPQLDHLTQRLAMPLHQLVDGGRFAPFGPDQQFVSFRRIRPHGVAREERRPQEAMTRDVIMCETD